MNTTTTDLSRATTHGLHRYMLPWGEIVFIAGGLTMDSCKGANPSYVIRF